MNKPTLPEAIKVLTETLKNDPEYYYTWQANIAMAFNDEFWSNINSHMDLDLMDNNSLHNIANKSAIRFLSQLIMDVPEDNKELPGELMLQKPTKSPHE